MEISVVGLAFLLFVLPVACWLSLPFLKSLPLTNPDGFTRVTGNCGDTMEMALRIVDDRVTRTWYRTDGCSISHQCIEAAALLAHGRHITEVRYVNMVHIMELMEKVPETHLHCVQLAETTLQGAVADYFQNRGLASYHGVLENC